MATPFTAEDKKKINETLRMIEEAKKDIARAKMAQIDVSEPEARLLDAEKKLRAIKQAYFPTEK